MNYIIPNSISYFHIIYITIFYSIFPSLKFQVGVLYVQRCKNCEYNGNDVIKAPNVTIVSKTKDLPFDNETFDTIILTECFEHDPTYKESFLKIYDMLKKDGLFFFYLCINYIIKTLYK
ncbi:MAG: hypothetical protein CMJ41_10660 [Phycisphaerae bacterium]|nr:hypothetical protein [Phycisphaerae bacterium]